MKVARSSHVLTVLLVMCSLNGPFKAGAGVDKVIGSIGDIELHESELLSSLGTMGGMDKEALATDPAALDRLVRSMLVQRLVLQEALARKWDENQAIQPLLRSTREAAITDSYLKSLCRPPEGYPGEEELKAAYESAKAAFTVPRSYRLAQIYVAEPDPPEIAASERAQKRLDEVLKQFKESGASAFGRIAREWSEEKESASRDGEIGWLREDQIRPDILAQLPRLRLNEVSEPVHLKDGWHILKVLDAREPFTPIFDQVRVQLAQRLRAEKVRSSMQAYMSEMLQKHPVVINEVVLSKLLQSTPIAKASQQP